jgi:hypothetical protein
MTHTGFWRNLSVKQSQRTKEILLTVVVKNSNFKTEAGSGVTPEMLAFHQLSLRDFCLKVFMENEALNGYKLQGLLWVDNKSRNDVVPFDSQTKVLHGEEFYHEVVHGLKFKVNKHAFLQVNTVVSE